MSEQTAPHSRSSGGILSEGKTKIIRRSTANPEEVIIASKDDITAGDGAKHDLLAGKAAMSTMTTCNVFRLLRDCGIPVAFGGQIDAISFSAPGCTMLPYEVVTRREAHGSYLKRNPTTAKGELLPALPVELYLKTSKRRWKDHALACDDPLMQYEPSEQVIRLYEPSKSLAGQAPFLTLPEAEVFTNPDEAAWLAELSAIAKRAFLVLEKAWQLEGGRLVDCKVEFGRAADGRLLLADVIDNDSWRVIRGGSYIDKQLYREGGALEAVSANYQQVAAITGHFRLPNQRIVIWGDLKNEGAGEVEDAVNKLSRAAIPVEKVACSPEKETETTIHKARELAHTVPDTAFIACGGKSLQLGALLEAHTTVPVIVASGSLDFIGGGNVLVASKPANAALIALEILALRNPRLYMDLREPLEKQPVP